MTEADRILSLINAELDNLRELQDMQRDFAVFQNMLAACHRAQELFNELQACIEVRLLMERV